jgi:hypothetical protein
LIVEPVRSALIYDEEVVNQIIDGTDGNPAEDSPTLQYLRQRGLTVWIQDSAPSAPEIDGSQNRRDHQPSWSRL